MALEMSTGHFQITTISSVSSSSPRNSFFISCSKEKLLNVRGLRSASSLPVSTSLFSHSVNPKFRNSTIVCKAREAVDQVGVVNDSSWDSLVLGSESPVLVDFWAPWCGPCRMIAPIIDELAKEYAGKIVCFKLNTDESPTVATKYGIRSIPTVLFFKGGEKKESIIGAVPKSTLTATIEKYLEM